MRKCFILAALLLVISPARAGLISYQGYTLDPTTKIVTGDGVEWLQWTVTLGQTVEEALAQYSSDGWAMASNKQIADVYNAFGLCAFQFDSDETTSQSCLTGYTAAEDTASEADRQFIELFGDTRANSDVSSVEDTDPFFGSYAIVGSDPDDDGLFNYTFVYDDVTRTDGEQQQGRVDLQDEGFPVDAAVELLGEPIGGVALARVSASNTVPAPGSVALVVMGLLLLLCRRVALPEIGGTR